MKRTMLTAIAMSFMASGLLKAQEVDPSQLGAWYMYFFDYKYKESRFGAQGDIQFRNWDLGGDLEQLLIRGGLTYRPKGDQVKFTLGYGNITSGAFGESTATSGESRMYQEALLPQKLGTRFKLTHRFRYEQRWVEGQDFRTRYRYALFLNVPFNKKELEKGAVYLALYNELFINGQKNIGDGRSVEWFDRNRFYCGLGYGILDALRVQVGIMRQSLDTYGKTQLQLSLHHKI